MLIGNPSKNVFPPLGSSKSVRYYRQVLMNIRGRDHLNQCIHFLNQSSATFKKWWNEPDKKGELSRKEQFQNIFQEKKTSLEKGLGSLEKYIKTALTSRQVKVAVEAPKTPPPEAFSKVVKELDAVLKEYSSKPLPKPPSQTFPKAMHVPNKPLPKIPTQAFPEVPSKPLPPVPSMQKEAESNIADLKQALEDALPADTPTFKKATAPKTEQKADLNLGQQRTAQTQETPPEQPEAKVPSTPSSVNEQKAKQPSRIIPPRRKPPERKNKALGTPIAAPSMATAKPSVESVKGPSQAENQDISFMMQALVKMQMDKAALRDILLLKQNKSNPISKEREQRGLNMLKERGILAKDAADFKGIDIAKVMELMGILESNERKLQENVNKWYEQNGSGIRF